MLIETFKHTMAAHCESGTLTALLNHKGLNISEPMIFGMGSGLYFGYLRHTPNLNFPMFILRTKSGKLRKKVAKRIGIKFKSEKYKNPEKAEKELDSLLEKGIPVAVQVDLYYMEYIPEWERVHANIHFITIVGKEDDYYIVSDSYFPKLAKLHKDNLRKARFAKGYLAPKGFMYYIDSVPESFDQKNIIRKAIKETINNMIGVQPPFIGVRGMRMFGKKVVEWPKITRDIDHLSHEVMKINIFLEDQGTGGGGFRFLYATFLRQAAELFQSPELESMSKKMMEIGDGWRNISYFAAKIGKNRDLGPEKLKELGALIVGRADAEEAFYKELKTVIHKI
ncbi:MAG TPA: BtrH N-terminal domain-containing protein [Bacteroidales bacterium]|mgnify:CR=1 FL=1|nr:BtrH N-terminal domain-containing protein [Bacteroidales bacterium]